MAAGALNIEIEQGATFRRLLTWTNANGSLADVTGYTGKLQIRQKEGAKLMRLYAVFFSQSISHY